MPMLSVLAMLAAGEGAVTMLAFMLSLFVGVALLPPLPPLRAPLSLVFFSALLAAKDWIRSNGLPGGGVPAVDGLEEEVVLMFMFVRGATCGLRGGAVGGAWRAGTEGDSNFSTNRRTPFPSLHGATTNSYPLFLTDALVCCAPSSLPLIFTSPASRPHAVVGGGAVDRFLVAGDGGGGSGARAVM